jgi:hypothetical protein
LNFEDVKKYFKYRYYSLIVLLSLGTILFLVWSILFFWTTKDSWLNSLHFFGFFYFVISLIGGVLVYALVLGTVIHKYKEFENDIKFKIAFYKITSVFVFSIALSLGMAKFVTYNASKMNISVRNGTDKRIEKIMITYPNNEIIEMRKLEVEAEASQVIFPQGEGSLVVKVTFLDGSSTEKVVIGYLNPTINRTYHLKLNVTADDIQVN